MGTSADSRPSGATGGKWPILLLVGMIAGAVASIVATVLRRPRRTEGLTVVPSEAKDLEAKASVTALIPPRAPTRWRRATKYIVGIGLFLAGVALLYAARSTLHLLVLAALVAFIVQPIIRFLHVRIRLSRGLSVLITYLLVLLVFVLAALVVIPRIVAAIGDLIRFVQRQDIPAWLQQTADRVRDIPVLGYLFAPTLDTAASALGRLPATSPEQSYQVSITALGGMLASSLGFLVSAIGTVASAFTSLAFLILISVYMSVSAPRIRAAYPKLIPPAYLPEVADLIERVEKVWAQFLRGQLVLMVYIGTIVFIGNAILGNRAALLLGLISGFLEVIPNIGPVLAIIPGVGLAFIFGSSHFALSNPVFALIVAAFYVLVQVSENQFIVPLVLGGAMNLPPLVIVVGCLVGGAAGGVLGVILAAPIIGTGIVVFGYLYRKILEPPPEPPPPPKKSSRWDSIKVRLQSLYRRAGERLRAMR